MVLGGQQRTQPYLYMYPFFPRIPLSSRLPHTIEQSSWTIKQVHIDYPFFLSRHNYKKTQEEIFSFVYFQYQLISVTHARDLGIILANPPFPTLSNQVPLISLPKCFIILFPPFHCHLTNLLFLPLLQPPTLIDQNIQNIECRLFFF